MQFLLFVIQAGNFYGKKNKCMEQVEVTFFVLDIYKQRQNSKKIVNCKISSSKLKVSQEKQY